MSIPDDYELLPAMPHYATRANLIALTPGQIVTAHEVAECAPDESLQDLVEREELVYLAVLERHGINGNIGHGLLKNFGLKEGAVASTVGHDAHNLIVAGTNEHDMRVAVETLKEHQGGIVIVRGGEVLSLIALPVAGLLSEERAPVVARKTTHFKRTWEEMGCTLPYMGFNLLPLTVIPALRLTDRGLVLVAEMRTIPLFEHEPELAACSI